MKNSQLMKCKLTQENVSFGFGGMVSHVPSRSKFYILCEDITIKKLG